MEILKLKFGHLPRIIILAVIAGLVVWLLLNFNPVMDKVRSNLFATDAEKELKRIEDLYKNDKYGGKTPEETFDLFIEALKKEDACPAVRKSLCGIDLASKYFIIQKQDDWLKTLREYKNRALLSDFVLELQENRKNWERKENNNFDIVEFNSYIKIDQVSTLKFKGQEFKVSPGEYLDIIRFEKYPSNIWKISLL